VRENSVFWDIIAVKFGQAENISSFKLGRFLRFKRRMVHKSSEGVAEMRREGVSGREGNYEYCQ
jgi:hypothetical protein